MKMKNLFLALSLMSVLAVTTVSCEKNDDKNVSYVEIGTLPVLANDFLSVNFKGLAIRNVEKYSPAKINGVVYEVNFKNDAEVEFDQFGNWVSVEAAGNDTLPTSFILPAIVTYINTNYPQQGIHQIEKLPIGFEVELTNDIDLVFDSNGQFVKIDR